MPSLCKEFFVMRHNLGDSNAYDRPKNATERTPILHRFQDEFNSCNLWHITVLFD